MFVFRAGAVSLPNLPSDFQNAKHVLLMPFTFTFIMGSKLAIFQSRQKNKTAESLSASLYTKLATRSFLLPREIRDQVYTDLFNSLIGTALMVDPSHSPEDVVHPSDDIWSELRTLGFSSPLLRQEATQAFWRASLPHKHGVNKYELELRPETEQPVFSQFSLVPNHLRSKVRDKLSYDAPVPSSNQNVSMSSIETWAAVMLYNREQAIEHREMMLKRSYYDPNILECLDILLASLPRAEMAYLERWKRQGKLPTLLDPYYSPYLWVCHTQNVEFDFLPDTITSFAFRQTYIEVWSTMSNPSPIVWRKLLEVFRDAPVGVSFEPEPFRFQETQRNTLPKYRVIS
jgi:hypothetical protein